LYCISDLTTLSGILMMREHFVANEADFLKSCEKIAKSSVFGFDTEFVSEESFRPELCLVQVATPEDLFVIDAIAIGSLGAFWDLVTDGKRNVIVHAGREEIRICQHLSGKAPARLFDIQVAAGLIGVGYPAGYGTLVQTFAGTRLSKQETLTDWRIRPLTADQITYAFDDVRYLLQCHEKISARLLELDRIDWAEEEFADLQARSNLDEPIGERWRKVKGTGGFDRKRLAMVREIVAWREEFAAKRNRPPRAILRDDLIADIVKRNPQKAQDILAFRGIQHRDSEEIMAAIQKARALPLDTLPIQDETKPDAPQVGLIGQVMAGLLGDLCNRKSLVPGLVATASDLRELVRSKIDNTSLSGTNSLAKGWRLKHVFPVLMDFLEGKTSLRLARVDNESPFEYDDSKPKL
jgi:ribonuclease D